MPCRPAYLFESSTGRAASSDQASNEASNEASTRGPTSERTTNQHQDPAQGSGQRCPARRKECSTWSRQSCAADGWTCDWVRHISVIFVCLAVYHEPPTSRSHAMRASEPLLLVHRIGMYISLTRSTACQIGRATWKKPPTLPAGNVGPLSCRAGPCPAAAAQLQRRSKTASFEHLTTKKRRRKKKITMHPPALGKRILAGCTMRPSPVRAETWQAPSPSRHTTPPEHLPTSHHGWVQQQAAAFSVELLHCSCVVEGL